MTTKMQAAATPNAFQPTIATDSAEIGIEGLTLAYDDGAPAIRDLNLSVRKGEMLVLLGPSGCGKTSTMRCVVGLEAPQAGRITIADQVVFDRRAGISVPTNKRDIGMVFQSYAIWPHMSVFENVAFPLRVRRHPRSEIREQVEAMLETVGLGGLGERGASLLSGGQMQRVALARSLVMRPRVLLLDEPLSNLDAKLRERLRMELKEIQARVGVTSIYVTHDQQEALGLADRLAVMRDGSIEQLSDPISLYSWPASAFVAEFLGVSNLLPGVISEWRGDSGSVAWEASEAREGNWRLAVEGHPKPDRQKVLMCVRPEAISLAGGHGNGGEANDWDGMVEVMSFMGSHVHYRVAVAKGPQLDVVTPATDRPIAAGSPVTVRIPPGEVKLLDRERKPAPASAEPA